MKQVSPDETWPNSWKESYWYDLEEIYDQITVHGYAYAYKNRRNHALKAVGRVAPKGAKILDVAGAQGNFSLLLAENGYQVTWNDLRAELADYVALKHERGTIRYAVGDVFELGFHEEFDVVLITEIIEHVAHPDQFLQKVATLLKPGGHIVMTTPNGEYFKNKLPKFSDCPDPSQFESAQFKPNSDGHIFLLHSDELEPLAKAAGLQVEMIELFTNPLTNGHIKTSVLLKVLPLSIVEWIEGVSARTKGKLHRKTSVHMLAIFKKTENSQDIS